MLQLRCLRSGLALPSPPRRCEPDLCLNCSSPHDRGSAQPGGALVPILRWCAATGGKFKTSGGSESERHRRVPSLSRVTVSALKARSEELLFAAKDCLRSAKLRFRFCLTCLSLSKFFLTSRCSRLIRVLAHCFSASRARSLESRR